MLLSLPTELLHAILTHVSLKDLDALRASCKALREQVEQAPDSALLPALHGALPAGHPVFRAPSASAFLAQQGRVACGIAAGPSTWSSRTLHPPAGCSCSPDGRLAARREDSYMQLYELPRAWRAARIFCETPTMGNGASTGLAWSADSQHIGWVESWTTGICVCRLHLATEQIVRHSLTDVRHSGHSSLAPCFVGAPALHLLAFSCAAPGNAAFYLRVMEVRADNLMCWDSPVRHSRACYALPAVSAAGALAFGGWSPGDGGPVVCIWSPGASIACVSSEVSALRALLWSPCSSKLLAWTWSQYILFSSSGALLVRPTLQVGRFTQSSSAAFSLSGILLLGRLQRAEVLSRLSFTQSPQQVPDLSYSTACCPKAPPVLCWALR